MSNNELRNFPLYVTHTYTVKSGDTLGYIFLKAKKSNSTLTWDAFRRANKQIKNPDKIYVGDVITIPSTTPKASTISAEPKHGKCGNEFTFVPIGKNATMTSLSCKVNGKSSPNLEANQTYVLEREKIEESQQGSIEITVNGKSVTAVEDLSKFKEKINIHKDIKVAVTLIDKEMLAPAKTGAGSLDIADMDFTSQGQYQIPEDFRSPDQHATMTMEEMVTSMNISKMKISWDDLGIKISSSEKHTIITYEIPPTLPMDTGVKDINTMSDEEVEKLSDAMVLGGKKATTTLAATLASLAGTSKKRIFWKQQLWKGKFKITEGVNGSKLIHFYGTPSLRSMLKGVTDPKMIEKIKQATINPGTRYKMGKGFAGIQLKKSLPFFEGTKLGYLEKFLNGKTAMGGVIVSSIFSGTVETYKWYHEKDKQDIDLLAIWGIVIVKSAIGAGIVAASVAIVVGTLGVSSIVVTIGVGVVFAVIGGFIIESVSSYFDINDKAIQTVREVF